MRARRVTRRRRPARAADTLEALSRDIASAADAFKAAQGDQPLVHTDVDPDVVARVVSDWTGIPVGKMLRDQAQTRARAWPTR